MCDTFYSAAGPDSPAGSFFGKNSDRHPAEPQIFSIVPGRAPADSLKVGGKVRQLKDPGYSFVLSRPVWIEGGEMGINEKGVAIGNEAVFSRFRPAKDGTLGMDILRAALATSATAKDAVEFICGFVEREAQGGNGAFIGSLYYDNSFIVADPSGAFIVETAGRRWAWRSIYGADAISNAYSIEEDYKRLDTQTRKEISPVNERAACSDEADPGRKGSKESWKHHVENRFYLRFTKGEERRRLSRSQIESFRRQSREAGRAAAAGALGVLRSHGAYDPARPALRHMESICVHAGGIPATATTASMLVEYRSANSGIVWFTGTSCPCISLYKPLLWVGGSFIPLWTAYDHSEVSAAAEQYWKDWNSWMKSEKIHRRAIDPGYAKHLAQAQESLSMIADRALADAAAGQAVSAGTAAGDTGAGSSFAVLQQEAGAVIAGWEKDSGFRNRA